MHPKGTSANSDPSANSTSTVPLPVLAAGVLAVGTAAQVLIWIVVWAKHSRWLKSRARAIKDAIDGTITQPCFFCNEDVTLTKEELAITSGRSWQCTSCGQWNGEDELDKPGFGTPNVRYTQWQAHQQQQQHQDSLASYKNALFCATCVQNQNLVVRLVAAYDPGDEEYYEMTVDEHKAQLEERYPPLCRECAVGVRAALTNETNKIKRRLLHDRLVRSSTTDWQEETEDAASRGRFVKQTVTWWRMVADLWLIAAIAVMLAVHVRGIMYPLSFNATYCDGARHDVAQGAPSGPLRPLESLSHLACLAVVPKYEEDNIDCFCALFPALRWLNVLAVPGAIMHPLFVPLLAIDGDLWVYKSIHLWTRNLRWAKHTDVTNRNDAAASPSPPILEQHHSAPASESNTLGIEHAFQRSARLSDKASDARLAQFRAKRAFHRRLLVNLRNVGIPAVGVLALWSHVVVGTPSSWRVDMALTTVLSVAWAVAFACHQDEIARKVARRRIRRRVTTIYATLSLRLIINICAWLLTHRRGVNLDIVSHTPPAESNDALGGSHYLRPEFGELLLLLPGWLTRTGVAAPGVAATLVDLVGAAALFVCVPPM
ncbi:hypothetical protein HDU86_006777 [Geranomyces michiganensis]|nr:hypothetical protein HDU86_006777 [Geranomyces michiganensis]